MWDLGSAPRLPHGALKGRLACACLEFQGDSMLYGLGDTVETVQSGREEGVKVLSVSVSRPNVRVAPFRAGPRDTGIRALAHVPTLRHVGACTSEDE